MDKKRLLIFIFLVVLLSYFSYAFTTISLESPSNNALVVRTNNVSFDCSVDDYSGVNSISLYHNISGSFSLNQSASNPTVSVNFKINNTADGTYKWNCKVDDGTTNKDSYFSNSNYSFTVKYNRYAPVYSDIGNLSFKEDSYNDSVNLNDYFSDADGDSLSYSFIGGDNLNIVVSNGVLNITPNANWTGYSGIRINATDNVYSNTSNLFYADVTPVNDPPYLKSKIPDQNWSTGKNKTVDLTDYFDDVDQDPLNYSYTSVANINVTVSSGGTASLVPDKDFNGSRNITFSATDGSYNVSSNVVGLKVVATLVNVTVSNTEPIIIGATPTINVSVGAGGSWVFSIGKYDADNDSLTVSWYLDGNLLQNEVGDSYNFSSTKEGKHTVRVVVSDGMLSTSKIWEVEVKAGVAEAVCGDNKVDAGENCENCAADVKCMEGQVCKNKICQEKKSSLVLILIIFIILVIAAGFGVYFLRGKFGKKKEEGPREEIIVKEAEPSIKVEGEGVDVTISKKPESTADVLERVKIKSTIDLSSAESFIKNALARGWTEDRVKRELIKKGWRLEDVEQAFRDIGK